ncbi:hypothetical protein BO99DRAFT_24183 [Aspergillus violaceofuscus CBS 115571]|uniref:Uncharacterized protein n=1 Tax=Aspergillus violaceofuscus (strain CBS 115571) TaxID=1450538 RepID=A0A2V5GTA6_ASPV1|nr:hypothetical protein BO99DRAFT_24183 [Aspergillus violaceofuscus CBS 115571]
MLATSFPLLFPSALLRLVHTIINAIIPTCPGTDILPFWTFPYHPYKLAQKAHRAHRAHREPPLPSGSRARTLPLTPIIPIQRSAHALCHQPGTNCLALFGAPSHHAPPTHISDSPPPVEFLAEHRLPACLPAYLSARFDLFIFLLCSIKKRIA